MRHARYQRETRAAFDSLKARAEEARARHREEFAKVDFAVLRNYTMLERSHDVGFALEEIARGKGVVEASRARVKDLFRGLYEMFPPESANERLDGQRLYGDIMDEIDPFPGAYTLEVSSPGIDRPLRTREHFERFAGETAIVVLRGPYEGRAKWTGKLVGFDEGDVLLEVDGIVEHLPYDDIKKANIRGTFDFNAKA